MDSCWDTRVVIKQEAGIWRKKIILKMCEKIQQNVEKTQDAY